MCLSKNHSNCLSADVIRHSEIPYSSGHRELDILDVLVTNGLRSYRILVEISYHIFDAVFCYP